jgi:hypothetical protein
MNYPLLQYIYIYCNKGFKISELPISYERLIRTDMLELRSYCSSVDRCASCSVACCCLLSACRKARRSAVQMWSRHA